MWPRCAPPVTKRDVPDGLVPDPFLSFRAVCYVMLFCNPLNKGTLFPSLSDKSMSVFLVFWPLPSSCPSFFFLCCSRTCCCLSSCLFDADGWCVGLTQTSLFCYFFFFPSLLDLLFLLFINTIAVRMRVSGCFSHFFFVLFLRMPCAVLLFWRQTNKKYPFVRPLPLSCSLSFFFIHLGRSKHGQCVAPLKEEGKKKSYVTLPTHCLFSTHV